MLHDALPVDDCPFGPPPWVSDALPVDLGDLGVADRWADLAIATLSLSWNYAGECERELLDAYGIDPDPERIEHYRRLWNAGDISSH